MRESSAAAELPQVLPHVCAIVAQLAGGYCGYSCITPWRARALLIEHQADDSPTHVMRSPLLGEHTDEVLGELGYGKQEIDGFRAQKVI